LNIASLVLSGETGSLLNKPAFQLVFSFDEKALDLVAIFFVFTLVSTGDCVVSTGGVLLVHAMNSALTGQFLRRLGVGASYKSSPGYPFLLHPLPLPHDIGLTPHFKTLQSP
jgi:hypothetical protein